MQTYFDLIPIPHTPKVFFSTNIMATTSSNQPSSPPADSPTTGVRRHHTISAHSRSARATAKDVISEETQEQQQQAIWNDDEVVGEDWVGGVGAIGEKASLHRQASLPTRYHRGMSFFPFHFIADQPVYVSTKPSTVKQPAIKPSIVSLR